MDYKELAMQERERALAAETDYAERDYVARIVHTKGLDIAITAVEDGYADAVELLVMLRKAEAEIKARIERVKAAAVREMQRLSKGEKRTIEGVEVSLSAGRKTQKYTYHPTLDAAKEALEFAKEAVKAQEKIPFGTILTDPKTGETYEVQGQIEYSPETIVCKGL